MTETERRLLEAGDALDKALVIFAENTCRMIEAGSHPAAAIMQFGVLQDSAECLRKHDAWRALAREVKESSDDA